VLFDRAGVDVTIPIVGQTVRLDGSKIVFDR
jgi:hypothetical protein